MGYFANGTEGDIYAEKWCSRCVHNQPDEPCQVWMLHMLHNYEECNKKDSFLHALIPRNGIENERCRMFVEGRLVRPHGEMPLFLND